jgi:hypothetical protein
MAQQSHEPFTHAVEPTSSSAGDSGIDAGSSHDAHDQDNHGHHVIQAHFESDEVSTDTDEG